ncbi:VOC family protein [Pseudonocardia alni]|uniref:Glyoxalase superfamily protein PhnB n=1 Tax=Pseudonocardia alni TaxID=33907 RepID=A0AA44ZQB3_PSEA5|nr:VOC family protein [Pseudonocardia alni]PKB31823.1 putative glyoxalase superfamily protein PhnB [Pseudonocardia alni]
MSSTVWPVLHYDDPGAAVRFLVDAAGFTASVVVHDEVGDIVHAELTRDGGTVLVGGTKHDDGVHAGLRAGAVYVACRSDDDVDAVHRRVADAGGTVVQAPHPTSFAASGPTRACAVADPEGNLWTFATYPGGG